MLNEAFINVYVKFKLHFYRSVFARFSKREATLTAVECFCMEVILALNEPTINEFASFVQVSPPNAAYKVSSLIQKGYVEKVQSSKDKREYYLKPTKKYMDYYNISYSYLTTVLDRMKERLTPEEVAVMAKALTLISDDLMPEIPIPKVSNLTLPTENHE